jgi:outer membrane protein OmpA-like peptidoglycan-associated protein
MPVSNGRPDSTGVLENVFFDFDEAVLLPASFIELDKLVAYLERLSQLSVQFTGHTDGEGSDTHNETLSMARAQAVKAYLVSRGIKDDRITAVGRGSMEPRDSNFTAEGRARNRRVEFTFR